MPLTICFSRILACETEQFTANSTENFGKIRLPVKLDFVQLGLIPETFDSEDLITFVEVF